MLRRRLAVAVLVAVAVLPLQRLASQTPASEARAASERSLPTSLTAAEIDRDLDALQLELKNRPAYLKSADADYRVLLDTLRARGATGMSRLTFGIEVLKIVAGLTDGAACVKGMDFPPGDLPFYLESTDDRVVAVRIDRVSLVDPYRPYVARIDGRPIEEWLEAAERLVPKASPQRMWRGQLRHIQNVQFMRAMMGLPAPDSVTIDVESRDGRSTRRVTMAVSPRMTGSVVWPSSVSRVMYGNVGYLRIPLMDDYAANEIATWMPQFRETRGLVIDVRGNGGGNREALRALLPYFSADTAAARSTNAFVYGKPVVILLDEGSMGTTEAFAAAFKDKPDVTLMGTPSAGGVAPHVSVTLPVSQLKVTFTALASLQPNGQAIGVAGVQPEVLVRPEPDYFLARGWDAALEKAIDHVRR
ncbi:MAG TPA: S41 family peptidase [Gemmatimonadaceae bacterium]|nr:S41 family peptidase [Gemmatimonadaceae bacterium]